MRTMHVDQVDRALCGYFAREAQSCVGRNSPLGMGFITTIEV